MATEVLTFNLFDKQFTISTFPTVGQLMDIESLKISLTKGKYNMMVSSTLKNFQFNLSLVDAIAAFSVLLGKGFHKHVESLLGEGKTVYDLPGASAKAIVKVYDNEFFPWYKDFIFNLYLEEEGKEENGENNTENTAEGK